ncbi:MAG: TIM barrel protein [Candidatus Nanoarchaeia archaeon]|nr:TIM barrel protein [Candidatus Nanoarchaeia archaeon]
MKFSNDYQNTLDTTRKKFQIETSHLGVSTHPGKHQLQELKSAISRGGKVIELGWFGSGKGSIGQGNLTPELHSREERDEMRELAKINKVRLSTHASPAVGSGNASTLSGLGQEGFSKENQGRAKVEIDRALSFAADVAGGGPVVVHLGEFPRPVFEAEKRFASKDDFFESSSKERIEGPLTLVDTETGKLKQISRSTKIQVTDEEHTDRYGVPLIQEKTIHELIKEKEPTHGIKAGEVVYKEYLKKELELAQGEALRASSRTKRLFNEVEQAEELARKAKEGDAQAISIARNISRREGILLDNPEEALKEIAERKREEHDALKKSAIAHLKQVKNIEKDIQNTETVYGYGIERAAEGLAEEALKAYKIEKEKKLDEKLWIAVENWAPESYGNHPQELAEVIEKSRAIMANELKNKGMSSGEAAKTAADHIKATFDIGHANFWRKYFKKDPSLTNEQNDQKFNKWLLAQVKDLKQRGIIGHVHLNDNFGWNDEHLTPGAGNAPIEEFVKEISEGGWDGRMIIEPGGQAPEHIHSAVTDTWKLLNTPIYKIDGAPNSWTEIETSYFNQVGNPTQHIVGEYVPFRDWSSWSSEIPLE